MPPGLPCLNAGNSTTCARDQILNEMLAPVNRPPSQAIGTLVFHQYGNYVFQRAVEVLPHTQTWQWSSRTPAGVLCPREQQGSNICYHRTNQSSHGA
eukprot:4628661-Amphidinium_carterae.1